jgi:hypothetical protein
MKSEVVMKNEINTRIFSPAEMNHVSKFLCDAYKLNKTEWDKQQITILQAVKLALSASIYQEEAEKKLFKNNVK